MQMNIKNFIEEFKDKEPKEIYEHIKDLDINVLYELGIRTNKQLDYWNITNAIQLLNVKRNLFLALKFIDQTIDKVNDPYWLGYITKKLDDIVDVIKENDIK